MSEDRSTDDKARPVVDGSRMCGVRCKAIRRTLLAAGLSTLLVGAWSTAQAAGPGVEPVMRTEVDALVAGLASSGCRFRRNGRWHSALEASRHLATKWQEMRKRDMVSTAEQFIELGASRSMLSGQPYLVQCGSEAAQTSALWLQARLKALRAGR